MGAWGSGIFENDSALDWVWEFEAEGASAIEGLLVLVSETSNYLDVDLGSAALAACAIVANAHGAELRGDTPPDLKALIEIHAASVRSDATLVPSCLSVLDTVTQPGVSEVFDLWAENGEAAAATFTQTVERLKRDLRGVSL